MILEEAFWTLEIEAPVLRRNRGYLKPSADGGSEDALARVSRWEELCSAQGEEPLPGGCTDAAALRIFERDAERTFMSMAHRISMIHALKQFWPENKDYHQGLGYVYSFLRLTVPADAALRLVLRLNRSERHMRGYWFAAPPAYVRDAMVYARLVTEHFPEVAQLLEKAGLAAEAYVSKWFVGLCLHVLPFRALFSFYEQFLTEGAIFLFKFSLSLVRHTSSALLACKHTDASGLFAILRLDPSLYPDDHTIHDEIVSTAGE
ncbi:rab-GTPase-TBC domain-containing protein, partial [Pavlovales sp. CCMP2436]